MQKVISGTADDSTIEVSITWHQLSELWWFNVPKMQMTSVRGKKQ